MGVARAGALRAKLSDDRWLVYFAGRDATNRSRVFPAELDPARLEVRMVHRAPLLDLGPAGSFDEAGVGPGTAVELGDGIRLYFTGGRLRDDVPYELGIGVADSTDGGMTFRRVQSTPVFSSNPASPMGVSSPTVYRFGDGWEMYYSSWSEWHEVSGKLEPIDNIHRATSADGLTWISGEAPALDLASEWEGGLARAQILRSGRGNLFVAAARGWRDFRAGQSGADRLVFARSADGVNWARDDSAVTIEESLQGTDWARDMRCYPWLVEDGDRRFLFFNGNNFGRDGFGVGELEAEAV